MRDDHYTICRARNHLADALKILLKADLMTEVEFAASRAAATAAIGELDVLLRQPHRDKA